MKKRESNEPGRRPALRGIPHLYCQGTGRIVKSSGVGTGCCMSRIVKPEILDTLSPADPRAMRVRRDLRRLNFVMGNHGIMARTLRENIDGIPARISEIGAGDGHFLLRVAQKLGWQNVQAWLLDRQNASPPGIIADFSKINWRAEAVAADVFDWENPAEVVIANLFIHQFDDATLARLMHKVLERARLFIALEPHRFLFPYPCAWSTLLIGCSTITVRDAEASVRAGFINKEISGLLPDKSRWKLTERRAGLFGHLFVAKRL